MTTSSTGRMSATTPNLGQMQLPLPLIYPPANFVADTAGAAQPTWIPVGTTGEGVSR